MNNTVIIARKKRSLINMIGGLMLVVAGALTALLFFVNSRHMQEWYEVYQQYMLQLQDRVENLPHIGLILLAVLLLYAARSWLPVPIPMLVVITGVVLPTHLSVTVNIVGLVILLSVRFFWGRKRGGGQIKKIIAHQHDIADYLENSDRSRPWMLFMLRLLPNFALNSVSQIYGAMGFDYADFLLISLLGFLPKLISYTIAGRNWHQPLDPPFLIPLIIVFALAGITTVSVNMALNKEKKQEK